jgi:dihydrofolate synthase/folylpolyglutamate synthase
MNYDEAIEWLLSFADFERSGRFQDRPDVAPMLALLERLGNPHLGRTTVHIAGSKGKGTISYLIDSILGDTRVHTGLYTSPHLYSYTHRIAVEGDPLSERYFAELAEKVYSTAKLSEQSPDRALVTFDLLTAMAFVAFHDHWRPVHVQILETGLGGRVDSTNVFPYKDVAVITPISLEHTAILGDTVEKIAREKSAIASASGCGRVIMAPQPYAEARDVIREAAGSKLLDVNEKYRWKKLWHNTKGQEVRMEGPRGVEEGWFTMLGRHQLENAATAYAVVDELRSVYNIPEGKVGIGLDMSSAPWPCRIEVVREDPLVICDGAHNRDSARRLAETLVEYFACDRALFVIGCGSDKDIEGLAEELAPLASRVIATRAEHLRAMAPERIVEAFGRLNVDTEIVESVAAAVERALAETGESGVICVAGSLFVAAEARASVLGLPAGRRG